MPPVSPAARARCRHGSPNWPRASSASTRCCASSPSPLRVLDAEVEQSLLTLAVAIASHLTRRTLRAEPEQLIPIVRECLQQLPLGAREVRVRLHPEDAAVVREKLAAPAGEGAWRLVEDPMLTRGGCLIDSEHSRLDARLESRINALIAHALGDERAAARDLPAALGDPAP